MTGVKKVSKKIKAVKKAVVKPYNSGTMTSSTFFSMIRSSIRRSSRYWKPSLECKIDARVKYTGPNKKQKWKYLCNSCKNYFMEREISVDHIIPAGKLNSFDDIGEFCKRLFVEKIGLQVLCKECHNKKTQKDREDLKNE
jgi:hypothetical protein